MRKPRPEGGVCCGRGRNRTGDTVIFSHVLYRLSYPTLQLSRLRSQHGTASFENLTDRPACRATQP